MDRQKRPLGITALAFASVMAGIYSMIAALALLLGSVIGGVFGADIVVVLAVGALYFGLMVAAYFLGFGFWTQRHWSWAGGIVVFTTLIVLSILLTLLSTSTASAFVAAVGAGVAIWYLLRPGTKTLLLGATRVGEAAQAGAGPLENTQAVH